jgi:hypothetical protein
VPVALCQTQRIGLTSGKTYDHVPRQEPASQNMANRQAAFHHWQSIHTYPMAGNYLLAMLLRRQQ